MAISDPVALPLAQQLLACFTTQVSQTTDPPARVGLRPGDQVAFLMSLTTDECCEGLAWVRIDNVYASSEFPAPDETPREAGPYGWAVVLEVGVARCAPVGTATEIPSVAEWTALAEAQASDDAAIRRAIACCWADTDTDYVIGDRTALPVEGGCAGVTRLVAVAAANLDCCEE